MDRMMDARSTLLGGTLALAVLSSAAPARASEGVRYYGGRVISNVHLVAVFWTRDVAPVLAQRVGEFYGAIAASSYIDVLSEYDTAGVVAADRGPSSGQRIGRGTYDGAYTIEPSTAATILTTGEVAAELARQITSGALPSPVLDAAGNVDSLYMIDFPGGYTLRAGQSTSCSSWCGLHSTASIAGKSVPFVVLPDIEGCGSTCGSGFDDATIIRSHEMVEAITDAEAGLVDPDVRPTRPEAWLGQDIEHEIGDLCFHGFRDDHGLVAGYTVQKVWSNRAGACVLGPAGEDEDGGGAPAAATDAGADAGADADAGGRAGAVAGASEEPAPASSGAPGCSTAGDTEPPIFALTLAGACVVGWRVRRRRYERSMGSPSDSQAKSPPSRKATSTP